MRQGFFVFLLTICLSFVLGCSEKAKTLYLKNGHLDLSSEEFLDDQVIGFRGKVNFWWKEFLYPDDISTDSLLSYQLSKAAKVEIPYGYAFGPNQYLGFSSRGYGTYYFTIKIPDYLKNKTFGIYFPEISSSCEIEIVETGQVISIGKPARHHSESIHGRQDKWHQINPVDSNQLTFLVRVSNYVFRTAGIIKIPRFGLAPEIRKEFLGSLFRDLMTAGTLFVLAFYHFVFFLLRREDRASLHFSIFVFLVVLRSISTQKIFDSFVPDEEINRYVTFFTVIEYLVMTLSPALFVNFLNSLMPGVFRLQMVTFINYLAVVVASSVIMIPGLYFTEFLLVYQAFLVLVLSYTIFFLIKNLASKNGLHKKEIRIFLFFIMFVGAAVINDILYANSIVDTGYFTHYGILSFFLVMGFVLAQKSAYAHAKAKELSLSLKDEVDRQTVKLKDQNLQLMELDKQKTFFFQSISHELRTPLTLILNPLSSALLKYEDDEEIVVAQKNARRLLRLVNQLLDFQKLAAGKKKLILETINLEPFIRTCAQYVGLTCKRKRIRFTYSLDDELNPDNKDIDRKILIDAEIDALEKIIFNFLSNAIKFTPSLGSIALLVKANKDFVKIGVKDSGPGISKMDQNKLFKVFSQIEGVKSDTQEGTGLGLALAKELAEEMNAYVSVDSQPGQGSSFWIRFARAKKTEVTGKFDPEKSIKDWHLADAISNIIPMAETEEKSLPEIGIKEKVRSGNTVLIVDDLRDMRNLLEKTLSKAGFHVIKARNGREGFEMAKLNFPALIVSDWMMPVMNGPEMIQKIREDNLTEGIPVVLLTAKSDSESKIKGLEIGADAYLGKPFDERELVTTVQNLVKLKEKERFFEKELNLAGKLQNEIHENLGGTYGKIEISSFYLSSNEVGGDFMLIEELHDDYLFVAQCDLCGHGPQASLMSFYLRGIMDSILERGVRERLAPEDLIDLIVTKMDYQINEKFGDAFFSTFLFCIFDRHNNKLYCRNGAHPPAFLVKKSGDTSLVKSHQPALGYGWMIKSKPESEVFSFDIGDKMLIATDSILEIPFEHDERVVMGKDLYIEKSLWFLKNHKNQTAEGYSEFILDETGNKDFDDDCSIFMIRGI